MGDEDGVTIGGNHFIHVARCNVDVTAIVVNNLNYGMTGGQYSATTPETRITSTSRLGHIEQGFDICKLAEAAGAPFVVRATPFNPVQMKNLIRDGMRKKGFSMIEVIAPWADLGLQSYSLIELCCEREAKINIIKEQI